jgi:hypothetical protein
MRHSIRAGRTFQRSVSSESIVVAATNANATRNDGTNLKGHIKFWNGASPWLFIVAGVQNWVIDVRKITESDY